MPVPRKVALILPLWQNYSRGLLNGISAFVRENPHWTVVMEEVEHPCIPDLRHWDGDGLVANLDDPAVAKAVSRADKPVVGLGGGVWHDPAGSIPYVATDDAAIGRLAAEHFLERGLRHFAFCGYPPNPINVWVANRAVAFAARVADAGHACHRFNGRYPFDPAGMPAGQWDAMQEELAAWVRALPKPVGVMGCYDWRARHVLEACRAAGLRVPEDVAVIGVDNDAVCGLSNPPLSSVVQGNFQIGHTAAALLEQMMDGHRPEELRRCIPPVGVVSRQSTDLLHVGDTDVAAALVLIRERACGGGGLRVEDLVNRVHLSRSTLNQRFKQCIGRTVDQEIRRVRLERAKELLAQTNLPVREVALRSGYANERYLSAVVREATGETPGQYRLAHRAF